MWKIMRESEETQMKTKEEALCTMKGIEALLVALSQYTEKWSVTRMHFLYCRSL